MSVLLSEGGEMKKLADMNLVYDFLAYSLTAHKRYGEEASRFILECIPQRRIGHLTVVPQKVWHGKEPKSHGVRIDIYLDEEGGEIFGMEPDNNGGAANTAALRIVYTIQNGCVEEPDAGAPDEERLRIRKGKRRYVPHHDYRGRPAHGGRHAETD